MDDPVAVIVMGVAGSGKSTVGRLLAERMDADFVDADDLHPPANKAKMTAGVALSDEDRAPWLDRVAEAIRERLDSGRSVVVACSALRRGYRDRLRAGAGTIHFIHLDGSRELLSDRLRARAGHFMPVSLLDSQLRTLEPLQESERGLTIDIGATPQRAVEQILEGAPQLRR